MNTITLANKRDLPLTTDLLKAMQDAYSQLEALAAVVVPNQVAILTGCTNRGGLVDDGMMIYNGRIVPFKGGARQDMVRLVQTVTTHQVGNGSYEHTTWHAEFGVSPEGRHVPWNVVKGNSWKSLLALSGEFYELGYDYSRYKEDVSINHAMLESRVSATESKNAAQDGLLSNLTAWNQDRANEIAQLRADATAGDAGLSARVSATEAKNAEQDNRLDILGTENGARNAEIQDLSVFTHNGFAGTGQEIANLKTKTNTHAEQINNLLDATAYVPQVLFSGRVLADGTLFELKKHPHMVSWETICAYRVSTGKYEVNWSQLKTDGIDDYMVIINTANSDQENIGVRAITKDRKKFIVRFADDTTLNDTQFTFMVISTVINP